MKWVTRAGGLVLFAADLGRIAVGTVCLVAANALFRTALFVRQLGQWLMS